MIKACIFDLDGTLADTLESMAAVANELMDEIGLERAAGGSFQILLRRGSQYAGSPLPEGCRRSAAYAL